MTTLSLVATAQPANLPPRVKVDVTDTGTPAINSVTVTRTDAAGNTSVVRTPDGGPLQLTTSGSNRVGTVYDYEMPYGVGVTYSTSEQPANVSGSVSVTSASVWLVHPGVPDRSMPILVQSVSATTRGVNRGVFYPMGRANAVVVTDGRRQLVAGSVNLLTQTDEERRALVDLLADAAVLQLNVPASKAFGIDTAYLSVGEVTEARPSRMLQQPDRVWELPFVTVDAPVGGSQAQYTWADVVARYATWQDVINANATWAAVQTPTN